jgi:hypothetical protein
MRNVLLVLGLLLLTSPAHAQRDPYRWCAVYGGFYGGGATNCYFIHLWQCQQAISGVGGYCRPNPFYTGPDRRRRR